ncbi:hypothetical protein H310_05665 [Aphanomyces invadans]|uniref:Transmembrane protein 14C n=1 Tax=Aphanomyces invadans TaxID=157072 RepID=A0A024U6K3_9STRA|nr:hypothetical protein H310_05665 [Aphanomyces invadans]ETW02051.1 hypothetical protein H310_05665 [Aphanomyces invadans]RHY24222.1 hypothetical protein DYB32_008934 [Aphanomyces invadans]|eukprot:XP_008868656.1 hypothetical protein H310_05665 [Aphanomyces invadans]
MYDFCLTLPYGAAIAVGGIVGYVNSGSSASLTAGVGAGTLLLVFGYASYQEFQSSPIVSKTWSALSLGVSAVLSVVMGLRYKETQNFVPAGLIASTSIGMSLFYVSILLKNNKPNYKKN